MTTPRHTGALLMGLLLASMRGDARCVAQELLTPDATARWMAVGQGCQAPIIRIPGHHGDFDIYIEGPEARAAVVAATATMMHQGLDAPGVRTALQGGYRIWIAYTDSSPRTLSIAEITIRRRGQAELHPTRIKHERFVLGTVPSHGILESLRVRFPEFVFAELPTRDFVIALHTNASVQLYSVSKLDQSRLIRVCN